MFETERKEKNTKSLAAVYVSTLHDGMQYHGKKSVFYNQKTLQKNLKRAGVRDVSIRTINYDLRRVEDSDYILRYKRHGPSKEKGFEFKSTRYYLAIKGWRLLWRLGKVTKVMYYAMVNAILKGGQAEKTRPIESETPDHIKEFYLQTLNLAHGKAGPD